LRSQCSSLMTLQATHMHMAWTTSNCWWLATQAAHRARLALAIAVSTATGGTVPPQAKGLATTGASTLIFDEIDAGVGGTVADSVGRLMKQLGASSQVMAVTHLAQVAACADTHFLVSKTLRGKQTLSAVQRVTGEARVAEVARMLGGESLSGTAHAQALLGAGAEAGLSAGRPS
jgi:DNA repair protein RecN (Recombination protein N)